MSEPIEQTTEENYMWMRSPCHALDTIAELIQCQAALKEQDAWLKAVIKLKYVNIEEWEE